ncbi:hypothetical protein F442_00041 [Phytophthora nicotianae P10297]|uniref:Uncharacterized protein n=1 Tax=Phytophthora nicotianae P10297 TaxID=1317064 RepID=W3A8A2_PHYNI|nr:hypothetical protein F442_00041 [Phytophthora nicotianae P10297]
MTTAAAREGGPGSFCSCWRGQSWHVRPLEELLLGVMCSSRFVGGEEAVCVQKSLNVTYHREYAFHVCCSRVRNSSDGKEALVRADAIIQRPRLVERSWRPQDTARSLCIAPRDF